MILARQPEMRPEAAQLPPTSLVHRAARSGVERGSFRAVSPVDGGGAVLRVATDRRR